MKKFVLFIMLLLPLCTIAQSNENPFNRMKNYLGTWYLDETDNLSELGIPGLKLVCEATESENGAYCKIYGKTGTGQYEFMFSELLAYDKATDSFHFMSYMGNEVTYGSGPVTEDGIWTYTVSNTNNNRISKGRIDIKPQSMTQQIEYEDGSVIELSWSKSE